MATVKTIDLVGFGIGAFGLLMFTYMYLTNPISHPLGKGLFAFFYLLAVGGTLYFGYNILQARRSGSNP
ncbi:MAG: hypothetical protein ABEJ42_03475 [Halobacteriaceae archaeon]